MLQLKLCHLLQSRRYWVNSLEFGRMHGLLNREKFISRIISLSLSALKRPSTGFTLWLCLRPLRGLSHFRANENHMSTLFITRRTAINVNVYFCRIVACHLTAVLSNSRCNIQQFNGRRLEIINTT
jgi:hypothetical protein